MALNGNAKSASQDSISTGSGCATPSESLPRTYSRLSLASSSQEKQFRSDGHAEDSLSCMRRYLQTEQLCDVVLIAGHNGKRVPAHRLVLSAASEYFSAMFTGSLRESNQPEIPLMNISGDVLEAVVHYCYTGTIEIREDNVEVLLSTASLMQLRKVVEACSQFLAQQLHPSNCLGIAAFAEQQSCAALLQEANAYTNSHFTQVIQNQEFLQLSGDQMAALLSSDDLNVSSEEQIFEALMSWIRSAQERRRAELPRLLQLIKLALLKPAFLVDHVEGLAAIHPDCQRLLMEAMKWHVVPERRQYMASARTRPRKATLGRLLVVGGMDENKGATTIKRYDPRCNLWTTAYHMNGRRLQFGIASMGDKLLVVGGRDGLKTLNTMECLDLESGNWTMLSPMNTHRHGLGVAVLGGPLYAVGGHDGWSYLNTVERYDPIARSWNYVAPMQSQRCSAGVAVLNGKLYAAGGRDGASCLRSVECYDPHTNKWTKCAPMARRRGAVGVAVANGFLYAFGGQDAPANNPAASRFDCVERYDPGMDSWSPATTLSSKRDAVAVCPFGDRLVAVGGYDGSTYLRSVEQYDPATNEWTALAPLAAGRAGACVTPVAGPPSPAD